MLKIFEGSKCHVKFLLWALQNVIDYKVDARNDQTIFNIITIGGAVKEIPFILRAMVMLSGRDAHFFGDLNKVRYLWHENIKFMDLKNYFEHSSLKQLSQDWLKAHIRDRIMDNDELKNKYVKKVLLTYEVANKFIKEV